MTWAALLGVLAMFDCLLGGFRAAAGRNGRLEKKAYYRQALVRAALAGMLLVGVHVVLALVLVSLSPSPTETWNAFVAAAELLVVFYGAFATLTSFAFVFYLAPASDFRVLTSVIVLGPLTLFRPVVIGGGIVLAAAKATDPRVALLGCSAGLSMILFEHALGRAHRREWERLLGERRGRY